MVQPRMLRRSLCLRFIKGDSLFRTADLACSRSGEARTRFGDNNFSLEILALCDGPLNHHRDAEGKGHFGGQWMFRDSGVTVRGRYHKLDIRKETL